MKYNALIQNRKSVREYSDNKVPAALLEEIRAYYNNGVQRLVPELKTQLHLLDSDAKIVLEGAAGYNQFLIGAPQYLVLQSEKGSLALENAGYIMEDLILKLTELGLDSCWLTFADSQRVKDVLGLDPEMDVVAIAAFGYGVKAAKRLQLNILSMSNVDISAKRQYFEPKRSIYDLVFLNTWGNRQGLDEAIGFYDDLLWEAFYAASQSPSYLNRQAYGFVIHDGGISLVRRPDAYTGEIDGKLNLGIALLHFTAVAAQWAGKIQWVFGDKADGLQLPEGHQVIASCKL